MTEDPSEIVLTEFHGASRGERSEVRGRRSEVRGWKSEGMGKDSWQLAEDR